MGDIMSNEIYHYGIKGMKWGVRKAIETGRTNLNLAGKGLKMAGKKND